MKTHVLLVLFLLAGLAAAAPVATVQNVTQDAATGNVTVGYTLAGEDAIITFDVLTNGVPVSAGALAYADGDVYRLVATGSRSFVWNAVTSGIGAEFPSSALTVRVNAISPNDPPDWMAVELSVANTVFYYPSRECVPDGITNDVYKTERLLLHRLHAAGNTWEMGVAGNDRNPLHKVTMTNDFYIGVYEVTCAQFGRMQDSLWTRNTWPSHLSNYADSRMFPVTTNVSYTLIRGTSSWPSGGHAVSADSVIGKLRGRTGIMFDLPTEAQWEFACRAGTTTAHYGTWEDISWNSGNSGNHPHAVGTKLPNAYDLYDMEGNAWEWVLDWFMSPLGSDPVVDPVGPQSGSKRQVRGGCYNRGSDVSGSYYRISGGLSADATEAYGFRLTAPAGYVW
ncbi:MAG: formylglycine-generating enzyme family protein [Kiritimatiellae bacterium]|nr:formylglycine-generating enzyme family protein [Kiritimatiellia bacterium]